MKNTILWGENKVKILEEYKRFAEELLIEADEQQPLDDKEKEKAKSQGLVHLGGGAYGKKGKEATHKNVDGKLEPIDKDGDDDGADDSQKLSGKSDFSRDGGDTPPEAWDVEDEFGGEDSEVAKYLKSLQGKEDDEDEWDDTSMGQRNRSYGGRGFGDDSDGGDDKPKADEPKADEPRGAAIVGKTGNAEQSASKLSDIIDDAKDHEGKMPKGVARQVAQYEADILARQGINKSPDGTYSTSDYDEDEDEVIYEPMSEEGIINAIARETGKSKDEVVAMRAMAKESNPGVFPEDKGDDEKSGEESISDEDLKDTILQDLNPSRDSDRDERGLPNSKEDWENEVEEVDSAFKDAMEYYERTKKEYEDESVTDDPEEREYLKDRAQKAEKEFIKRRAVRDAYKEKGETLGLFDHVEPKKKPFLREQLERIGGGKY
tara:strand:- start:1270 stop:2568 length:1299 start_codon:yes stop_codon:yes gene_type:complete